MYVLINFSSWLQKVLFFSENRIKNQSAKSRFKNLVDGREKRMRGRGGSPETGIEFYFFGEKVKGIAVTFTFVINL